MQTTPLRLAALLMLHAVSAITLVAQDKMIKVTDLTLIKNITRVQVSPDAKQVLFEVKQMLPTADRPMEYDYQNHIFLYKHSGDKSISQLTGNAGGSAASWSPDSRSIVFTRNAKDKPQVFKMDISGGEAVQISNCKYGCFNAKYAHDGKVIIAQTSLSFTELRLDSVLNAGKTAPEWSLEKPGFKNNLELDKRSKQNPDGSLEEIRAYLNKNVEDKKAKVINRLDFQGEANVNPDYSFSHIVSLNGQEMASPQPVTKGYSSYIYWGRIGSNLLVSKTLEGINHDRLVGNEVVEMDLDGNVKRQIFKSDKIAFSGLEISPDGQKIAAIASEPKLLSYAKLIYKRIDETDYKTLDFDRVPNTIQWSQNSSDLYFIAPSNGSFPIFKANISNGKTSQITLNDLGVADFDLIESEQKIVMAYNDIYTPNELAYVQLDGQKHQNISQLNAWVKTKEISKPEKSTFKNELGQEVEYWIMKPTDFKPGKKYPLLLLMHGGPTAMWGPGENSMWHEFQYFAAKGYGIVYANPRGSGGYGKTFQFSNYRDWGKGPASDVLRACSLAEKEAWVDTSKLVITGGSYAGYLTAWIVAHDHRFKAAFSQRGVYDLSTFMGEGNAWRLVPNYFGLPWEAESITKIEANSPYNFLKDIKTPLLIKHGENDLRTGVVQSEMMFKSMKYLDKEVEYVRMPGATHELSRSGNPRQRIDRILRIYEFFERYIQH
jgi:dipeptidyl aminopeptidase/acylaminoacyl peptidase